MIVLNIFGEFFDENNSCNIIDSNTIIEYINFLKTAKPNANFVTINSYLRGIRAILYYCMELGYLSNFKIQLLKTEKKIKITYTDCELALLLKKPNMNSCTFTEYRNWVVTNYLLATGNRISTICNIKIQDIDFSSDTIILTKTKNRKQQTIPLSRSLILILVEYLKFRKGSSEDYLFCNYCGKQLTREGLEKAISSYNRNHGVMKTSPHLYRNTFAKKWLLKGR